MDYEEPKTQPFWSLGLDISPQKIKEVGVGTEWEQKERKIRKILHEIWEKGSADTNSLDLNWPTTNERNKGNLTSSNKERWRNYFYTFCFSPYLPI